MFDALKRVTVSQKIESSSKAFEAILRLDSIRDFHSDRDRETLWILYDGKKYCFSLLGRTSWKCPVDLAQMSLDNASSKIVEEIRDILQDNEKTLPSIAKEILKQVLKKKQSHPRVQGSLNASSKCLKRQERKNPKDSLIHLKGFVVCTKAQALIDDGATWSLITERFSQKLLWLT